MDDKTRNDKGVPFDGRAAMRSGWDTKANPFKADDYRSMRWLSEWWAENADCYRSHCESGPVFLEGAPLELPYKNWRGEVSTRKIQPIRLEFGSTSWHTEPQWLLIAWDIEKEAERSFALKDFNPAPEPEPEVGMGSALKALRENQRQLDADGCEVGVSREALSLLLEAYDRGRRTIYFQLDKLNRFSAKDQNLRKIAGCLKRLPSCHACVVEGQERYCECINARWAGREILRTLDRENWTTKALGEAPATEVTYESGCELLDPNRDRLFSIGRTEPATVHECAAYAMPPKEEDSAEKLAAVLSLLGNVEFTGGGFEEARRYADKLNDIRAIISAPKNGGA
jgi:hypothetical protein